MALFATKKFVISLLFGLLIFVAATADVSAQSRRDIERERQRIEREQRRIQQQRSRSRQDGLARVTERRVDNANYNTGYDQGFMAGQFDGRKRKYNQSNVYRGTGTEMNSGDPTSTDYIYRQGYLQGYEDGFHGRRNY